MLTSTPCRFRQSPPAHDVVERALAALVDPIGVVQFARPVHAQSHEDLVLLEERAPRVVELRAVGLDGVGRPAARLLVPLDVLDRSLEEIEAHERGLAALPADDRLQGPPATRATGGCRSRGARRPSGTGCRDRASPSRGRSSTCNRDCRSPRLASPADERMLCSSSTSQGNNRTTGINPH